MIWVSVRSSATLRILRGTKALWSRFFQATPIGVVLKSKKYWVGRVPSVPPCTGAYGPVAVLGVNGR